MDIPSRLRLSLNLASMHKPRHHNDVRCHLGSYSTERDNIAMHILHLPPELLDNILVYGILSRRFRRALRLKLVCSKPQSSLQRDSHLTS